MKPRFTLAQVMKAVRWTGAAIVILYCGFSMFLIISLAGSESDQDKTIDFIVDDNTTDACRDELEQEFLSIVGVLIIRQQSDAIDQVVVDRLTASVDRLDRIEDLCPLPERPED